MAHEPPKLNTGTALNLVVSAWSLTWTGLGSLALLLVLILESAYVTFDKVALKYIQDVTVPAIVQPLFGATMTTLELQEWTLILFGIALICTGLAIMPLYQKDEPAAAIAPDAGASAS